VLKYDVIDVINGVLGVINHPSTSQIRAKFGCVAQN